MKIVRKIGANGLSEKHTFFILAQIGCIQNESI